MTQATLFLDLDGAVLRAEEKVLLTKPHIGGIILFGRNTESADQVAKLIRSIRDIRPELIISIDQEGGRVQRLKEGVTRLPPVQSVAALYSADPQKGLSAANELGYLMAAEMRMLDIDLSFAPVLDVDYGRNLVIGNRAFAMDHHSVSALSAAYIRGMKSAGMAATGKHFPGHGWANADTHLSDAVDEREFEELWATDMLPFRQAIDRGIEAMMFAHVFYPRCAEQPAGYSAFWMQDILRDRLGFKGFVFSDDLSMKAAHSAGGYAQRAKKAVNSGCQVLLCCNDRKGTIEVLSYLESIELDGVINLAPLKGAQWNVDRVRLMSAQVLAKQLMDLDNA
jgi:beta-N-acetylhexosaminidase